ncbi:MAG: acylphosphatase [Methanofollis sp.]|uniref:acylphosphatase n=1 Tax=Methanofollis sp. TaxID=2052835 RepID=UPI00262D8B53|nr:acylphosphatase [Methanofollis sp.]MDD4253765.1 acylphosphatase [Methanofollis sp.]
MQERGSPLAGRTGRLRVHAIARGRVQGVGYRSYVNGCAGRTGVAGYVRNLPDGTVEMVAEGEASALAAFLDEVRARGEPVIAVEDLTVEVSEPTGEFTGFEARFGDRQEELFKRSMLALDLMKAVLKTEQEILAEQRKTNTLLEECVRAGRR